MSIILAIRTEVHTSPSTLRSRPITDIW